jgi:hypothetical protein
VQNDEAQKALSFANVTYRVRAPRNSAGARALVVAALLGLSAGPVEAYPGLPFPSVDVTVVRADPQDKSACRVSQALLPVDGSSVLVRIKVPRDSTLKSGLLKTASGELMLEIIDAVPLVGEYEAMIDLQKTNCATSGILIVDVEGDLEAMTVACPGILLPKPSNCR